MSQNILNKHNLNLYFWKFLGFVASRQHCIIMVHKWKRTTLATESTLVDEFQYIRDPGSPQMDIKKQMPMNCSISWQVTFSGLCGSHWTAYRLVCSTMFSMEPWVNRSSLKYSMGVFTFVAFGRLPFHCWTGRMFLHFFHSRSLAVSIASGRGIANKQTCWAFNKNIQNNSL